METSEIEVGAKYRNSLQNPKVIYLGIGRRKLFTSFPEEYSEKHLIILEVPHYGYQVGQIVQEGENAEPGFWDGFYKISFPK